MKRGETNARSIYFDCVPSLMGYYRTDKDREYSSHGACVPRSLKFNRNIVYVYDDVDDAVCIELENGKLEFTVQCVRFGSFIMYFWLL